MNGVEQSLVFQVRNENMLFMIRQFAVVNSIAGYIHFFWTPEEGELLFNQLLKNLIFLLVVTCDVDRLTKEHRFFKLVILLLGKSTVSHCCLHPFGLLPKQEACKSKS
ncbi:Uncharacterised protein [Vibrio cholerae]|nr:Uncharacterised protein [Vibrio cholerae]